MPSINLAPGTQYIVEMRKRRRRLLLLSIITIALVGGVWGSLAWYHASLEAKENGIQADIRNVNMQIAQLEDEARRIVLFENRLVALDTLLDRHITLDPILGDLERLLPANVVLEGVTIDSNRGLLNITGETENVDQVAEVLASLVTEEGRSTLFSRGELRNVTRQEQEIEGQPLVTSYLFSAELIFSPNLLRRGE